MNERQSYEEHLKQHWTSLPLPDENLAWEDMRRRLDEDDNDPLLPWWRRGCMAWGLLLLVLAGAGWWVAVKTDLVKHKSTPVNREVYNSNQYAPGTVPGQKNITGTETPGTPGADSNNSTSSARPVKPAQEKNPGREADYRREPGQRKTPGKTQVQEQNGKIKNKRKPAREMPDSQGIKPVTGTEYAPGRQQSDSLKAPVKKEPVTAQDTIALNTDTLKKDSTRKIMPEKKDSSQVSQKTKKDRIEKRPVFFTAGLAIHQQIPLKDQQFTPYSASGRKGGIGDYIPSVYIRVHKKDRWFAQLEFRYGAPQYNREFIYRQQKVNSDSTASPHFTTTSSYTLKKTFYHQLPLTFHWQFTPAWSAGAGVQWNLFRSAVAEKNVERRDNFQQTDTLLGNGIVNQQRDSAYEFRKSYFQAVVETQYSWKRFSLGARYAFGLQPYIRFALPNEPAQEEKNSALQLFLRFRLWKSKQKD